MTTRLALEALERAAGGGADEVASKLAEAAIKRNGGEPRTTSRSSSFAAAAPASAGGGRPPSRSDRLLELGVSGLAGAPLPEGLPQRRWLARYAEEFDTVESTAPSTGWPPRRGRNLVEQTPDDFVFAVKRAATSPTSNG